MELEPPNASGSWNCRSEKVRFPRLSRWARVCSGTDLTQIEGINMMNAQTIISEVVSI